MTKKNELTYEDGGSDAWEVRRKNICCDFVSLKCYEQALRQVFSQPMGSWTNLEPLINPTNPFVEQIQVSWLPYPDEVRVRMVVFFELVSIWTKSAVYYSPIWLDALK